MANATLEAYLRALDRPMSGVVDQEVRASFLDETRHHLERAIADRMEQGEPMPLATQRVLEEYGQASLNASDFLESWFECSIRTPLYRRFGHANMIAFGFFQAAALVSDLILQLNVFMPSEAGYHLPWRVSPPQIRDVWPEPLPMPDFSAEFLLMIGWPVVAPLIAGWIVGRMVPVRPAAAVYRGLMPIIVSTLVLGALLLPMTEGILLGVFQAVYWLPMGCAMAALASWMKRRRRRDPASEDFRRPRLSEA